MHNYYDLDTKVLFKELVALNNWEDYKVFEEKYFNSDYWEEKDIDQIESEVSIKPFISNGVKWKHLTSSYCLPKKYEYLHELCGDYMFKKLEYESAVENRALQGKYCVYCEIYTENSDIHFCPFCGHYLFDLP